MHDLRHSCAALLIEFSAHPKGIQERLGHRSITVTIDVYGHLFPALNEALTEGLDGVFRAARIGPTTPSRRRRRGTPGRGRGRSEERRVRGAVALSHGGPQTTLPPAGPGAGGYHQGMARSAELHVRVGSNGTLTVAAPQLADAGIQPGDTVLIVPERGRPVRSMLGAHDRGVEFEVEDQWAVPAEMAGSLG